MTGEGTELGGGFFEELVGRREGLVAFADQLGKGAEDDGAAGVVHGLSGLLVLALGEELADLVELRLCGRDGGLGLIFIGFGGDDFFAGVVGVGGEADAGDGGEGDAHEHELADGAVFLDTGVVGEARDEAGGPDDHGDADAADAGAGELDGLIEDEGVE